MATTPVVPAAVPAAPAPAPAPAAAPPAASPAPPPASPAPAAPSPTAQPVAGAPPTTTAAPSGPQPPAKLNPGEYGNATDSYMAEVQWKQDLAAFKEANPDVPVTDESPWEGTEAPATETPAAEPEVKSAEGETKPAETETAADAEPFTMDDGPAPLTPQALNDLLKGDEALKAAVEANPAAKGALFKMARENAELSQFKGIFPNKDAATFARDTANRTIGLRSQFQMAETPEGMSKAFDSFIQEFAVVGADGKQVMDETGQPVYGDDLYLFGEHVVDRYADSTLAEVEARIAANQYTDDAQRERDNDLKLALSIIKDDLHPADPAAKQDPDLSHLDENTRKEVQARLDEAKRIESENAAAKAGSKKQNREQVRTEGNAKFFADAGKRTFEQARGMVEKLRAAGAVIPQWQLDAKVPGQNYTAFDNEVGKAIESHIKADPYESNKQMQLELQYIANPTPENLQARLSAFDAMLQSRDDSGKSLLNRIVTKLVRQYGQQASTAATAAAGTNKAPAASVEPKAGPAARPQQMSPDDAYREATKQLASEVKDWHSLGASEQMSQTLARQRRLLVGR